MSIFPRAAEVRSKGVNRRHLLRLAAAGLAGASTSGWIEALADVAAGDPRRRRACILLWMTGGPSQLDTFDLKPGHANGGPFKPIETSVPGIAISEHLPKLARQMEHLAVIRSMSTKEGDHGRATFLLHTGYVPQGPIHYPCLGSLVAKELEREDAELPGCVSIAPYRSFNPSAFGPGFLGPRYAPLVVGEQGRGRVRRGTAYDASELRVADLARAEGIDARQADARLGLLDDLARDFQSGHTGAADLEPSQRLRTRGPDASLQGRRWRSTSTASPTPCATPTAATRSARVACWHAGWSSRVCRSSRSRCRGSTGARLSAGTRTRTTSSRSRSSAPCSIPAGRP